jgi:hypothetical protein
MREVMRLRIVLGTVALAAVAAASAHAQARPLRPADGALLQRSATSEERVAEAVAKRLTRLSPVVRCGPLGVNVPAGQLVTGITLLPPHGTADYFLLLPEMCNYLTWFRRSPERYDPDACRDTPCLQAAANTALALATVSHESYHVLGYRVEKQVECYGMQSIWFVASSLGASVAEGQRIAAFYWRTMYARRQVTTPTYWSAECRDGGTYDLRPASHAWPS